MRRWVVDDVTSAWRRSGRKTVILPREVDSHRLRLKVEIVRIDVSHRVPAMRASSWCVTGMVFPKLALSRSKVYAKRRSTGAWAKLTASAMWRMRVW